MFKLFGICGTNKPQASKSSKKFAGNSNLKYLIGEPGGEAIVDEMIQGPHKSGRVQFRGSWWPARCDEEVVLVPGEVVYVVGISDITLIVEPGFSVYN